MKATTTYNIGKAGSGFTVSATFDIPQELIDTTLGVGVRWGLQRVTEVDDVLGIYSRDGKKRVRNLKENGEKMTRGDVPFTPELAEKLAGVLSTITLGDGADAPKLNGKITVTAYEGEVAGPAYKRSVKEITKLVNMGVLTAKQGETAIKKICDEAGVSVADATA